MRLSKSSLLVVGAVLVVGSTPEASAQAPGATNPGVQLQEELREQKIDAPNYEGSSQNDLGTESSGDETTNDTSDETIFLKGIRFKGNTIISSDKLIEPFINLIGKDVSFKNIAEAVSNAEKFYKESGYITSRVIIAPQNFDSGYILLDVIEGYIESIDVKGGGDAIQAYMLKMLQPVFAEGKSKIFNFKDLEKQLLLTKDFGAVNYNVAISKGQDTGGSVLTVSLKPQKVNGSVTADNFLPSQLGDWQLGASASYYVPSSNPVKINAGAKYSFPFSSELINGYVVASTPIGNEGFVTEALWAASSTKSDDLLDGSGTLKTKGSSNYWSFGIGYPLILERNSKLSISLNGTGQNSTNDLYLDGKHATDLSTDRIRSVRLSVDGYLAKPTFITSGSLRLSQGISGLGDDLSSDEFLSNPVGESDFTAARLELSHLQKLPISGLQLHTKASGQLSSTALPVPEQFTYGGQSYGRAFKSVHILGDEGWTTSVELNYPVRLRSTDTSSITPFVWYDYGSTSYKKGALTSNTAATYGMGLRGTGFYNTTFEVGLAVPGDSSINSSETGFGSSSVYFNAGWNF